MNISCDVIRDLLPLYAEDMVSRESARLVEEHIKSCPSCAAELEGMKQPVAAVPQEPATGLKHFRKRVIQWMILGIMASLFFSVTLVVWGGGFLLRGEPMSMEDAIVSVSEEDGIVYVELSPTASAGLKWRSYIDEISGERQHYLCCGKRTTDWLFPGDYPAEIVELPLRGATSVWYYENGEMICLYGNEEPLMTKWGEDPVLLPALVICCVLALGAWLLRMKWIGYAAVLSGSLAIADLVVTCGTWIMVNGDGLIMFAILFVMALLLTCCVAFVWELIQGSAPDHR